LVADCRLTVGRTITLTLTLSYRPLCGGGLEYLHRSHERLKRRRKRNPVPECTTGPPVPGGHKYSYLDLQAGGVSNLRQWNMVVSSAGLGPRVNCTNKLQIHPIVREGAPYQETRNYQTEKNLAMGSRWEPNTKIDSPTDRRLRLNLNLNSTSIYDWVSCEQWGSGTQRKGNVRRWNPIPSNGSEDREREHCCLCDSD
jgi:hypothetical protein